MSLEFTRNSSSSRGIADSTEHEPRRPLPDTDILAQLDAADALFVRHKDVYRHKPLLKRQGAVLEDRTHLDGELFPAISTFQELPVIDLVDSPGRATFDANRPPPPPDKCEFFTTRLFIGKTLLEVKDIVEFDFLWKFS